MAYKDVVLADSPTGYWRMDAVSGNETDITGNGHTGVPNGGSPTYGVAGALSGDPDTAMQFNGSSNYLYCGAAGDFDYALSQGSMECWVKDASTASMCPVCCGTGIALVVGNGAVYFYDSGSAAYVITANVSWPEDGKWHHLVATWNHAAGTSFLYLDGVLIGRGAWVGAGEPAAPTLIGVWNGVGNYWNGSIDEVAIYHTALTGDRVLAHYLAGMGSSWVTSPYSQAVLADNPSSYWHLDDPVKSQYAVVADASGNGQTAAYWTGCSGASSLLRNDAGGGAVSFAPASQGLIYAGPTLIVAGAKATIELWAYRRTVGGLLGMTFTQGSNPSTGNTGAYCLWGGEFGFPATGVEFAADGNASGAAAVWTTPGIPPGPNGDGTGQVIHQVIKWSDAGQQAELWINGVSQGVRTGLGSPAGDQYGLALGYWAASSAVNYLWDGVIDEVSTYSYLLSAARIQAHYAAGVASGVPALITRRMGR